MRLLLTRPKLDSETLARLLEQHGHSVTIDPLLDIRLTPDKLPPLDAVNALIFTSANGVRAFIAASARRDLPCYAVGERTAIALQEAGFTEIQTAEGDVDSLAQLIIAKRRPKDGRLLHIAGTDIAGDLAGCMTEAGFGIDRAVLYEALAGTLDAATIAGLRDGAFEGVLLFSPRTARAFAERVREADLGEALKGLTTFCLSAAVADTLEGLPLKQRAVALRPTQDALLDLIDPPAHSPQVARDETVTLTPPPEPRRRAIPRSLVFTGIAVIALVGGGLTSPIWTPLILGFPRPDRQPPPLAQIMTPTDPRVDLLEQNFITLQHRMLAIADKPSAAPGDLSSVIAEQHQLAASIAALDARITTLEQASMRGSDHAAVNRNLLLALSELQQSLTGSGPFDAPLGIIRGLAGGNAGIAAPLAVLSSHAATGIPSRITLGHDLSALEPTLLAPAPLAADASWSQRITDSLSRLVIIKHIDDTDDRSPDRAMSLALEDIDHGDLVGAVARIDKISGPPNAVVADWLGKARSRLEAERATDALAMAITSQLGAGDAK